MSSVLVGKDRGQLSEKKKERKVGPKQNNTQLWMCLVVKVKTDAVKNNTA